MTASACASGKRTSTPSVAPQSPAGGPERVTWASPGGLDPSVGSPVQQSEAAAALAREFAEQVGERVFFAFDSYALEAEARDVLDAQARWLVSRPELRVLIAGHADERGTREYNLGLGGRRAHAAREHLIAGGVGPDRIQTVSYGKERPLDPGSNEAAWSRNRNAHTVLIDLVTGY